MRTPPLLPKRPSKDPELIKQVLTQANGHGDSALMVALCKHPTAVQPILNALATCSDPELKKRVLTQANSTGSTVILRALLHNPTAVQPILDVLATCKDPMYNYIDLMMYSKHALADLAETNDCALQKVLSFLATRPLNEQQTFFASWAITFPLLKQRGLKELYPQKSLQTLINKTQTLKASTPSNSWERVSSQLQNYLTKSPRKPNELIAIYKLIDELTNNTDLQTQFDASIPSLCSQFSIFKSHRQDYATTVKQLKQQLCEMSPDLHLEQFDCPSNQVQANLNVQNP
jgi:hypothetical protein